MRAQRQSPSSRYTTSHGSCSTQAFCSSTAADGGGVATQASAVGQAEISELIKPLRYLPHAFPFMVGKVTAKLLCSARKDLKAAMHCLSLLPFLSHGEVEETLSPSPLITVQPQCGNCRSQRCSVLSCSPSEGWRPCPCLVELKDRS